MQLWISYGCTHLGQEKKASLLVLLLSDSVSLFAKKVGQLEEPNGLCNSVCSSGEALKNTLKLIMRNTRRHLPSFFISGALLCSRRRVFWHLHGCASICGFFLLASLSLPRLTHFKVNYVDIVSFSNFFLSETLLLKWGAVAVFSARPPRVFSPGFSHSSCCISAAGTPPFPQQLLRIHATPKVPQRRPRVGGGKRR